MALDPKPSRVISRYYGDSELFKMKTIRLFLIILWLIPGLKLRAQSELQFSQYMFNLLYINPAYAGFKEQINSTLFFRSQYAGFSGAPTTASLSLDAPIFSDNMAFGLQINDDKIGIQSNLTANFAYSYRVALDEGSRICFGLQGGISQFSQNTQNTNPSQPGDPILLDGNVTALNFTSRFGLFYYNPSFYLGVSASNLYTQTLSNSNPIILVPYEGKTYYATGGVFLPINDNFAFKPSFLIKSPQAGITTADLNCFVLLSNRLWLGTSYRTGVPVFDSQIQKDKASNSNALLFLGEFFINERFRIGYSFDYPLSPLITAKSGSHEFSIGYYIPISRSNFKNQMVTPRYF